MKQHFTPKKGWMNDPNGAIYINGEYHIFYQYYPDDTKWGPMHWGHAVSMDLVNWEHKDIALFPDELGFAFSGSCIYDETYNGRGALLAFYTAHNPETGEQQQCMAVSYDLEHFEKYEGNPILSNRKCDEGYLVDFRDPKVFKNPVKPGYSMILAAGSQLHFYYSENFKSWEKTSEFDPSQKGFGGICECPDCFSLEYEGEEYWILSLSSILSEEMLGNDLKQGQYPYPHVMQYFIGRFDGDEFKVIEDKEAAGLALLGKMFDKEIKQDKNPLILDFGPDNYAQVTFFGSPDKLMIGWGECWDYVNNTPERISEVGEKTRGKLTLARRVALRETNKGLRLSFEAVSDDFEEFELVSGTSITLFGESGRPVVITLDGDKIWVLRKPTPVTDKINAFSADRLLDGSCKFKVYRDGDYFEIYAEDGLCVFSIEAY